MAGLLKKALTLTKGLTGLSDNVADAAKTVKRSGILTKELSEEALEGASLYERMAGKKLNAGGMALVTGGTMLATTVGTTSNIGINKSAKLGDISIGENFDRMISYDGSGFIEGINRISGGNTEVMQDIVENTFDNPNQFGVSGDIVFALHNMREG